MWSLNYASLFPELTLSCSAVKLYWPRPNLTCDPTTLLPSYHWAVGAAGAGRAAGADGATGV